MDGLNSTIKTEEGIRRLEDKTMEITQSWQQWENRFFEK